jgi:hypothetical protein
VLKSDRGPSCKRQDESGGWLLASRPSDRHCFTPFSKWLPALHAFNNQLVDDLRYRQIAAKTWREYNM